MKTNDATPEQLDVMIETTRSTLDRLLDKKKKLIGLEAIKSGCKCGAVIISYRISRLHNVYCPVHNANSTKKRSGRGGNK